MNFQKFTLAVAALVIGSTFNVVQAQQSVILTDNDDFAFRGCVRRTDINASAPSTNMLVFSRGDIMLGTVSALGANAPGPVGTSGSGRVFYWLDHHDKDDLARHVGQMVEIEGHLKDFTMGEVEVNRKGALTEIEIKAGGHEDKVSVPTSWLKPTPAGEQEYDIVTRRVDVHKVRVLGACN